MLEPNIESYGTPFFFNKIAVSFIPNIQYTQLDAAQFEKEQLNNTIKLLSSQVKGVIIEKSYQTHSTEIVLDLINIDTDFGTRITEGKYIIYMQISTRGGTGQANYFVFDDVEYPTGVVYGEQRLTSLKISLKSVTRRRLELENNFAYELGGKGGAGAASSGVTPFDFFHGEFANLYSQNHALDDEVGGYDSTLFNMALCAIGDSVHRVTSTPPAGYLMDASTNLEVIDYFFKVYPIFKTFVGWIIDDFDLTNSSPTTIRVSDFIRYDAWEPHIDVDLSKFFNKELTTKNGVSKDFASAAIATVYNIKPIEHVSLWDWVTFIIRDKYPKIFAINVMDDTPIPMDSWNGVHQNKLVMVNSRGQLKLKRIENPMYREYVTFLNETEIGEVQLYKTVFKELHPEIDTYEMYSASTGQIDLHTIVEFKKSAQLDAGYGKDRIGMCYKVRHEYVYAPLKAQGYRNEHPADYKSTEESPFLPEYVLNTRFALLTVDKGSLDITAPGAEDKAEALVSVTEDNVPTLVDDGCEQPGGTYGDGGGLPGNTSVGDQAESYISTNFSYCYGCTSNKKMDCSAFTQKAVRAAGIKNYPRTTLAQVTYCKRYGKPVSVENIQRGDILFFWFKGGHLPVSHTGIAASSSAFYHATRPKGKLQNLAQYKKPVGIYRLPTPGKAATPKLKKDE